MRTTSFLIGGIVGAAAAMYFTRNGKLQLSNWGQTGQMLGGMMGQGKQSMTAHPGSSASSGQGLDEVKKTVNSDPSLKRQVDEIVGSDGNASTEPSTTSNLQ